MTETIDVIIVGGGPSGSSAAYYLAQAGLSVLVLDKAAFPRDKTCGDGLTPRALHILDDMGLLPQIEQQSGKLAEIAITAPSGRSVALPIPEMPHALSYAAVVPRLTLDTLILEKATASGAVFHADIHVLNVETDASGVAIKAERANIPVEYRAKVAIIAVGASTRLLSTIGLLPKPKQLIVAARAYFEGIEDLPNRFQFRFDGVPLPGYGWVFPLSDSSANIGAGFLPSARKGKSRLSAQSGFEQFIQHPSMKEVLVGAHRIGTLKSFPIRTDFATASTFADRILLVGEAAGLVNPLTGDGIDYALESGKMAADYLIGLFKSGDFSHAQFRAYDDLLRERYQNLFRFCERVQQICLNARALNLLVPAATKHPRLAASLVNTVLGGQPAPKQLSPLALVRGIVAHW